VLLQTLVRLFTWTLPVFISLLLSRTDPIEYLRLKGNASGGLVWGLIIGAVIILYNILGKYALTGSIGFDLNISANNWVNGIALVGFSEEILFRGFILRNLNENIGFWASNIISAALFALVHIIGWIMLREFVLSNKAYSIAYLLFFSLVQGFVLKKTDSLWSCIVIHSINNFVSFALAI
jgi:membrane protease YdiL (CAAX protease family)